ncbi:MAG: hypothetical protein K8W52_35905 [Deltaproteobacteria bacterium]|nr:hypothetical protein [Deltaproteobacteria bacterium]
MSAPPWTRPLHRPGGGDALVFFEVHGTFPEEPPVASTARYHLDAEIAPQIEVFRLGADAADRRAGVAWDWFAGDHPALASQVARAPGAVIIRGQVADPADLRYLRHAIGLVQMFLDRGGLAVHDLQTLRWYPADEWRTELFEPTEFRPHAHIVILTSAIEGRLWLHTRGMRKFGRPDLSMRGVPPEMRDPAVDLVDRFIGMQTVGGTIPDGEEIKSRSLPDGLVCRHAGDLEDPDFNNVHVDIDWPVA